MVGLEQRSTADLERLHRGYCQLTHHVTKLAAPAHWSVSIGILDIALRLNDRSIAIVDELMRRTNEKLNNLP